MHLTLVRYIACYCTLIIITVIYTEKSSGNSVASILPQNVQLLLLLFNSVAHDLKEGQKIKLKDKLSSKALFTQRYLS